MCGDLGMSVDYDLLIVGVGFVGLVVVLVVVLSGVCIVLVDDNLVFGG